MLIVRRRRRRQHRRRRVFFSVERPRRCRSVCCELSEVLFLFCRISIEGDFGDCSHHLYNIRHVQVSRLHIHSDLLIAYCDGDAASERVSD